ncbi:MAG: hypothetical protein Q9206_004243, partial [Seirophora lacunosa]
ESKVRFSDHDDDDEEGGGFIIPDDGEGGGFIPDDDHDQETSVGNTTPDHVTVREPQPTRVLDEEQPLIATTATCSSSSAQQDEGVGGNIDISQPSTAGTASHQNDRAPARLTTAAAVGDEELEGVHHPAVPEEVGQREQQAFELPMTDAEVEEARILQELYESGAMDDGLPRERTPPERMLGDERVFGMEKDDVGSGGEGLIIEADADRDATMVLNHGAEANPSSSEEEDDKGSLISEDPDDEDAEPEWLP